MNTWFYKLCNKLDMTIRRKFCAWTIYEPKKSIHWYPGVSCRLTAKCY